MQAPVFKRTTTIQFVGLALVLGLIARLSLSAATLTRSDDDAALIATPQEEITLLVHQQRYFDATAARLDAMESMAGTQDVPMVQETFSGPHHGYMDGADQSVAPAQASSFESNPGQIGIDQFQAEQRFAPTALDQFIIDAGA